MAQRRGGGTSLLILIGVPAVVSLLVTLAVLRVWEGQQQEDVIVLPTPGPTAQLPEREPTAAAEGDGDASAAAPDEIADSESPPPDGCENPLHEVQSGQTLGVIADEYGVSVDAITEANLIVNAEFNPDILSVGQEILIPVCGLPTPIPTEPPTPTTTPTQTPPIPTATAAPAGSVVVSIARVINPGDITAEAVEIVNEGAPVNLAGWTLTSEDISEEFTFPAFSLFTGGAVTVYTRVGDNDARSLYRGLTTAVWEPGVSVSLSNRDGELIDSFLILDE
ncbi:MAG: lamin tail domain-containing protein [Anaerolineae bacterium]